MIPTHIPGKSELPLYLEDPVAQIIDMSVENLLELDNASKYIGEIWYMGGGPHETRESNPFRDIRYDNQIVNLGLVLYTDDRQFSIFPNELTHNAIDEYGNMISSTGKNLREIFTLAAQYNRSNVPHPTTIGTHILTLDDCLLIESGKIPPYVQNWAGKFTVTEYQKYLAMMRNGFLLYPVPEDGEQLDLTF